MIPICPHKRWSFPSKSARDSEDLDGHSITEADNMVVLLQPLLASLKSTMAKSPCLRSQASYVCPLPIKFGFLPSLTFLHQEISLNSKDCFPVPGIHLASSKKVKKRTHLPEELVFQPLAKPLMRKAFLSFQSQT